jgi:adenylate kinase
MRALQLLALGSLLLPLGAQQAVGGPVVVFIGPPGSGKSTQAAQVAKKYKLPVITPESLIQLDPAAFEKNRTQGISGLERDSDPFLNRLFLKRMEQPDVAAGFILDGYPATKDHADFLAKMLAEGRLPKSVVVLQLDIPDEVARKRMEGKTGGTPGSLEQRLKDYHREMDLIRVYFPSAEIQTIDATPKISKVRKQVESALKQKLGKK